MTSLRQRFRLSEIWRRARRNAGLKAISVVIALGLWVFVNAGQRGAVEALQVPISYRSLPTGLVIINHPPDFVKIEVAGPRTLLSLLDPERLTLKLDLAGVPTGVSDFKINPPMFNVPRQTSVTRITPANLQLDIDRVVSREIPVHLALTGKVANGYQISGVQIKPLQVAVSGPSRYVMPLKRVDSEPFAIGGATANLQREVALARPNRDVHLSIGKVIASVDVTEVIANREFKGVPVAVRNTNHKYRLEPAKATITLRGPALKLANLDPSGIVYIDAKGDSVGYHDMPLLVELPSGMQLVNQAPQKVKIRIYREMRPATADGKTS